MSANTPWLAATSAESKSPRASEVPTRVRPYARRSEARHPRASASAARGCTRSCGRDSRSRRRAAARWRAGSACRGRTHRRVPAPSAPRPASCAASSSVTCSMRLAAEHEVEARVVVRPTGRPSSGSGTRPGPTATARVPTPFAVRVELVPVVVGEVDDRERVEVVGIAHRDERAPGRSPGRCLRDRGSGTRAATCARSRSATGATNAGGSGTARSGAAPSTSASRRARRRP